MSHSLALVNRRCASAVLSLGLLAGSALAVQQGPNANSQKSPEVQAGTNQQHNPPEDQKKAGDPVDPATGNLIIRETDLSLQGRGLPLSFTRSYRSGTCVDSVLGPKWDFNWNQNVCLIYGTKTIGGGTGASTGAQTGGGQIQVSGVYYYNGDHRVDSFTGGGGGATGVWQPPKGCFSKLIHHAAGPILTTPPTDFVMRNPDGTVFTFGLFDLYDPFHGPVDIYRLTQIKDRKGNVIQITYTVAGTAPNQYHHIDRVTDGYGQYLQFNYSNAGDELLTSVSDSAGRTVVFTHDTTGSLYKYNLTDVRSPTVTGTPAPGNDFPTGKTVHYVYYPNNTSSEVNSHLISAIDAPQEYQNNSLPNPVPYLQNTYDSGARVIKQIFGGTNASGVAAGGSYVFIYENTNNAWTWFTEKSRTMVIDPNGNVELTLFDSSMSDCLNYRFSGRFNPDSVNLSAPPSTTVLVSIQPSSPTTADHLVSTLTLPVTTLRPHDFGCFFTKKLYNTEGLVVEQWDPGTHDLFTYDSNGTSSPDVFSHGNLLKHEQAPVGGTGASIITTYAYEPLYNQLRATIDPRGNNSAYVPPNGGTWSMARYMTVNTFDYQEQSALTNAAFGTMITDWQIDTAQANQATVVPATVLPSITSSMSQPDTNQDGSTSVAGNVTITTYPAANVLGNTAQSSNQPSFNTIPGSQIITSYNAFSLPTKVTDPLGFQTTFVYFPVAAPFGPGTATAADGGFAKTINHPQSVTETFGYDNLGRMTQHTDGRNDTTTTVYNALDQVMTVTDAKNYVSQRIYDWNNNVVQTRVTNKVPALDANGIPTGTEANGTSGASIQADFQFDILDHLVTETRHPGLGAPDCVTRYRYDRCGSRVLTLLPEWSHDASNVVADVRDERGLVWKSSQGGLAAEFRSLNATNTITELSSIVDSTGTAVSRYDYDLAANVTAMTDPEGKVWTTDYDSFERVLHTTDPIGNYQQYQYDPCDQVVDVSAFTPGAPGTLVAETKNSYDERGRLYQVDKLFTAPVSSGVTVADGPLSPGDGFVTTRCAFDKRGQVVEASDDNLIKTSYSYDGLGRMTSSQAAPVTNNRVDYAYDNASNLIKTTESVFDSAGANGQTFVTWRFYDELNRLTAVTNSANETTRYLYDSRDEVVFTSDAVSNNLTVQLSSLETKPGEHAGLAGTTNDHGNTTVNAYDDIGRQLSSARWMRVNGTGGNVLNTSQAGDGKLTVTAAYDMDSRVVSRTDDNGNASITTYDPLNRPHVVSAADGTGSTIDYFKNGLVQHSHSANGADVVNQYNNANQLIQRTVTPPIGGGGTTLETYSYDALNRCVTAQNNAALVTRDYDSLSDVVREQINGKFTKSVYDGVGNLVDLTYPGARRVVRTYDGNLGQLQSIRDFTAPVSLANYDFYGDGRLNHKTLPLISHQLTVGYTDGARRVTSTDWRLTTPQQTHIDQRSYVWDRAFNKTSRTQVGATTQATSYAYDSAYRMLSSNRTGTAAQSISYALDGVGNRTSVTGGSSPGSYAMTPTANFQVNQYSSTPFDTRAYDPNGNLAAVTATGKNVAIKYDYRNQMVDYNDTATGGKHHTYSYDAFGRRVAKTVNVGAGAVTTLYFYLGAECIEEESSAGLTQATYVFGLGMTDVTSMRRGTQDYYYLRDDMGNVMKLIGSNGLVAESYDYGDYGEPLNGTTITPITTSAAGNPYFFTGGRYDFEVGFYYLIARYLEPATGRFTSRDPIGTWGDTANVGNPQSYCGNNPWTLVDPLGLKSCRVMTDWERYKLSRALKVLARVLRALERGDQGNVGCHGSVTGLSSTSATQGDTRYWGSGGAQLGGTAPGSDGQRQMASSIVDTIKEKIQAVSDGIGQLADKAHDLIRSAGEALQDAGRRAYQSCSAFAAQHPYWSAIIAGAAVGLATGGIGIAAEGLASLLGGGGAAAGGGGAAAATAVAGAGLSTKAGLVAGTVATGLLVAKAAGQGGSGDSSSGTPPPSDPQPESGNTEPSRPDWADGGEIPTTKHGAERIDGPNATRGGCLTDPEIRDAVKTGQILRQRGGGTVYVKPCGDGSFNVALVSDTQQKLITSAHVSDSSALSRLAQNYGWH